MNIRPEMSAIDFDVDQVFRAHPGSKSKLLAEIFTLRDWHDEENNCFSISMDDFLKLDVPQTAMQIANHLISSRVYQYYDSTHYVSLNKKEQEKSFWFEVELVRNLRHTYADQVGHWLLTLSEKQLEYVGEQYENTDFSLSADIKWEAIGWMLPRDIKPSVVERIKLVQKYIPKQYLHFDTENPDVTESALVREFILDGTKIDLGRIQHSRLQSCLILDNNKKLDDKQFLRAIEVVEALMSGCRYSWMALSRIGLTMHIASSPVQRKALVEFNKRHDSDSVNKEFTVDLNTDMKTLVEALKKETNVSVGIIQLNCLPNFVEATGIKDITSNENVFDPEELKTSIKAYVEKHGFLVYVSEHMIGVNNQEMDKAVSEAISELAKDTLVITNRFATGAVVKSHIGGRVVAKKFKFIIHG